jgi:hypothetical protein
MADFVEAMQIRPGIRVHPVHPWLILLQHPSSLPNAAATRLTPPCAAHPFEYWFTSHLKNKLL